MSTNTNTNANTNMIINNHEYQKIWDEILNEYMLICSEDISDIDVNMDIFKEDTSNIYIYSLMQNDDLIDIDLFNIQLKSVNDYINYSMHKLDNININEVQLKAVSFNEGDRTQAMDYITQIKQQYQKPITNEQSISNKPVNIVRSRALKAAWSDPAIREKRVQNNGKRKEVRCITTNEIFASANEAAQKYNVSYQTVQRACNKIIQGFKDPKTQQLLEWEYTCDNTRVYQPKTKTYTIYNLYYDNNIVFVICSSLPKRNVLPYQKCNKNAVAYSLIQEKGYEHFSISVVESNIPDKTSANMKKLQHINELIKKGIKLYNSNL